MNGRERITASLARALVAWYRLRLALPRPVGGLPLLRRRLLAWTDAGRSAGEGEARALAELFRRALAEPPRAAPCVPRSLALVRLLRLHGFPAGIRIGLRHGGAAVVGHAWVEHHGVAVGEDEAFVQGFRPLRVSGQTGLGGIA